MFTIITLKKPKGQKKRQTHIARGVKKGVIPKNALCGRKFKHTAVESATKGNVEFVSCQRCVKVLESNSFMFR